MSVSDNPWQVVGSFQKRAVSQGEVIDFSPYKGREINSYDIPILLYDINGDDKEGFQVPRYIAQRIAIPPPSEKDMKVLSLAPPLSNGKEKEPEYNFDCVEKADVPVKSSSKKKTDALILSTVFPAPSHLAFIVPLILFLADIAALICYFTVQKASKRYIAAGCILIAVPDVFVVLLIIRRGMLATTIAFHLVIWPSVIILFLQPQLTMLFFFHIIICLVMLLFVMRLRKSSYCTCCFLG
ncbi:hypothetical protein STCU_03947 [Strigomonas culicis]|uniref:Uncharacterized protein n=1 Tax=Strigomonas culicis TaxID=28005 RepID=S9UNE0_9TRYP|nr:hypothetical protein STCU_04288 [Strigomonas culicis]EPY30239.1 hypothetical protein STCU_04166 [Strigomonas culicis]EPY30679.1 hypothetical protein STCU_03947 [Strigomonas culicis]|eukprot:EPY29996.1 hypothetical protein STCU_04288 [Strigomonas culicis]